MKKLFIALLATATLATTVTAHASQNGYQAQNVNVTQALRLADDARITITGQITRALGDEKYELQDSTGKVRVEIDDDLALANQLVGKTVTITGEVDKGKRRTEIDADQVRIH